MDVHWVDSNEHAEHTFPHCALRTPRLPQRVMGWSMRKWPSKGGFRAELVVVRRPDNHATKVCLLNIIVAVAGWRRVSMRLTPYWRGS